MYLWINRHCTKNIRYNVLYCTWSIKYCILEYIIELPGVPVFVHTAVRREPPNATTFWVQKYLDKFIGQSHHAKSREPSQEDPHSCGGQ
jgi:hypothetical protein